MSKTVSLTKIMPDLKIPPEKAILMLSERIDDLQIMMENQQGFEYYDFIGRCSKIWSAIDEIYRSDDIHPEEIRNIGLPTCSCNSSRQVQIMLLEVYHSHLLDYIKEIQGAMT